MPYQYNTDLVEGIRPILKYIAIALLIFSLILNIMTFKWRYLADFIIYFEAINTSLLLFIPSIGNIYSDMLNS